MSLAAAVLMVVEGMETRAKNINIEESELSEFAGRLLREFAGQLRVAVAASGEDRPLAHAFQRADTDLRPFSESTEESLGMTESRVRRRPPSTADRAAAFLGQRLNAEEAVGERMAVCVGGSEDGCTVPLNPQMPTGAFAVVGAGVYQLRADGKMHYDEGQTNALREQGA